MTSMKPNYKASEIFWGHRLHYRCVLCSRMKFVQCSEDCKRVHLKSRYYKDDQLEEKSTVYNTALHQAILCQNYEELKALLKSGVHVHSRDLQNRTALHMAALFTDLNSTNILLDHGADVYVKCDSGESVFIYALRSECLHIIQLLIRRRAFDDVYKVDDLRLHGVMDLDPKVCQFLIHNGIDVNAHDSKLRTPLHVAVREGKYELVELLLRHGAKINDTGCPTESPLSVAVQSKPDHQIMMSLLSRGADVNYRMPNHSTLLHEAVKHCDSYIVHEFLKRGAIVNAVTTEGQTPLHCILKIPEQVNMRILEYLLKYNANVNAKDRVGQMSLHYVTKTDLDSSFVLQKLIDNGASVNTQDTIGWTPLHNAMRFQSHKNVLTLLYNGANLESELKFLKSRFSESDAIIKTITSFYVAKSVLQSSGAVVDEATLNKLFGVNNVKLYLGVCKNEVELMKTVAISDDMTVFQFLHASKRNILILLSKSKKKKPILPESLLSQFPHYRYFLERKLDVSKRKKLIRGATTTLDIILRSVFPVHILENIINPLTTGDMINLIKSRL